MYCDVQGLPVDLTPTRLEEVLDDDKLPGSFDDGDPQTTNLYVGNLSPQVYSKYNWHVYYAHAFIFIPPFSKRSWSMFLRAVFECICTLLYGGLWPVKSKEMPSQKINFYAS